VQASDPGQELQRLAAELSAAEAGAASSAEPAATTQDGTDDPGSGGPGASAATGSGGSGGYLDSFALDNTTALQVGLRGALLAETFPPLQLEDGWREVRRATEGPTCEQRPYDASVCDFPQEGTTKDAVILGDSQVQAWLPGVREALSGTGYHLRSYSMPGCPVPEVPVLDPYFERNVYVECEAFRNEALAHVEATAPDLVIVTNLWTAKGRLATGAEGAEADAQWRAATTGTLQRLSAVSPRVMMLDSPPTGQSVADCQTAIGKPVDCEEAVTEDYRQMAALNGAASVTVNTQNAAAAGPGVAIPEVGHIAVENWFCLDGLCPAFSSGYPIYADPFHVSPSYGRFVAPLLRPLLLGG